MSNPAATESLVIDLRIADPRWEILGDVDALAARTLSHAAMIVKEAGQVSVLMTADSEMRDLNRQWRQLDKPTDVLSFPSNGVEMPGQPRQLGDIALGYETALCDAEAMSRPFEAHIGHLLIHGFLHLVGYDHIEPKDAAVMEPLEAEILAGLGWPDPYASGPYTGEGKG